MVTKEEKQQAQDILDSYKQGIKHGKAVMMRQVLEMTPSAVDREHIKHLAERSEN